VRNSSLSLVAASGAVVSELGHPCLRGLDDLFQPLDTLLASGGDDRLTVAPGSRLNMYGCAGAPRTEAIELSSSTASSISAPALERLCRAREQIIERGTIDGFDDALDQHIEHSRESLRIYLGLSGSGAEVVFSPSGTDSQLHALFLAEAVLGGPLTTVVVGADQTGSGTAFTARGRHFNRRTGMGKAVIKGAPLCDYPNAFAAVDVPFATSTGAWHSLSEIDDCVTCAVEEEIRKGRKVLLQAMHASKFGLRGPSDACLEELCSRWPNDVLVVVDACQARIGRAKTRRYLDRGYALLVTGSKFYMGPPFSGALLVPKRLSAFIAAGSFSLGALNAYLDRSCLPSGWRRLRGQFALVPNPGQWLRWEAALEEMRLYDMLPLPFRSAVMSRLQTSIPNLITTSKHLMPLALPAELMPRDAADEEFVSATIFPFLIRTNDTYAPLNWAKALCETLNVADGALGRHGAGDDIGRPCHIGQPVALPLPGGIETAAPRICVGARNLFEAWSTGADPVEAAVQAILQDVDVAVRQLDRLAERLS